MPEAEPPRGAAKPEPEPHIDCQQPQSITAAAGRYTVAEGDTLFNIARYELGKASRWAEIYDLNREVLGKDFNYLTPGTKLTLPESEKADVIAQPPASTYRR